jgi:branched-chain amino acid aminotransferase
VTLLAVAVEGRGLVDPAEPVFRAGDEALLRGGVAFETMRSYGGVPFLLDRHLERFSASLAALALPSAVGAAELVRLAAAAAPPDHVLRLYRTEEVLVVTASKLPPQLEELRARGLRLGTVSAGTPSLLLAGAKTTSYGVSFAARRAAIEGGADDALLVSEGRVLEAATANVWAVVGGALRTPPVGAGVLPGVTRGFVLEVAAAEVAELPLEQVRGAEEVFTTSSIREVMPVASVDGLPVGDGRPGAVAARLQSELRLRSTP